MDLESLSFGLLSGSDNDLASALRDYLSDKVHNAKALVEDIAICVADQSELQTLKTKWINTKIPIVNDGSYFLGENRVVQTLTSQTEQGCTVSTSSIAGVRLVVDLTTTQAPGDALQYGSVTIDNVWAAATDIEMVGYTVNSNGTITVHIELTPSEDDVIVQADVLWVVCGETTAFVISADGETAPSSTSLYISTDEVFDYISQMHQDVDDEHQDNVREIGHVVVDKLGNKYFTSFSKLLDVLTSSNQTVDVIISALDTISMSDTNVDFGTLLTNFKTILSSKYSVLSSAGLTYFYNIKDILVDDALSIRDKIGGIINILSAGAGDLDDHPDNRLSEVTGVSPFTALIEIGQVAVSVAKTVLSIAVQVVLAILGTAVVGAFEAAWKVIKTAVGAMDAFVPIKEVARAHFNKYTFRGKIPKSQLDNRFVQKLENHPGRVMCITTPFALIAVRENGTFIEFDFHWIPIHPGAFDTVFGGIQSSKYIYNGTPNISIPTTTSEANDLLEKLFQLGQEANSYTIDNDYLVWKGVWLSQYCFCYWIGLLSIVSGGSWSPYLTVLQGILHNSYGFNDYISAGDVTNVVLAKLLCGSTWSSSGYWDVSQNGYVLGAIQQVFDGLVEIMVDDSSFYPYSYRVAVPIGRYTVYSDSALNAIGVALITVISVAVAATASVVVVSKIKKAAYKKRTMAQAMSWECLDKNTGKLDPSKSKQLNKCRKQEKLAGMLDSIVTKVEPAEAANAVADQLSSTGPLYNAQRMLATVTDSSVYTDSETPVTITTVYKSIVG